MYLIIAVIMMASGLCAVVTCSQVSKLPPFSRAPQTGPELPAAESDSTAQNSAPLTTMSSFSQRCAAEDRNPLMMCLPLVSKPVGMACGGHLVINWCSKLML